MGGWGEVRRIRLSDPGDLTTVRTHHAGGIEIEQPPIRDYGIIGDARSTALVSRSGSIDWWCIPGPAGDPVFGRLLDTRVGGFFEILPTERFEVDRDYTDATAILRTTFRTRRGEIELLDFMPALTEAEKVHFPIPYRAIVRRVRVTRGEVELRVTLRIRPGFGRVNPRIVRILRSVHLIEWGGRALHLVSTHPLDVSDGEIVGVIRIAAGERADFAIAYSPESPADLPTLSGLDLLEEMTARYWREWAGLCTYAGPYRKAVVRSAITLKLLTYAPSGAIIAAPTTSLPEELGGARNWDYRYCWVRDAAFTVRALLSIGYEREAHAFAEWLLHTTRLTRPALRILYTVYGDPTVPEHLVELDGYRGSRPVRIGNAAANQFQLDIYGDVADALTLYQRSGGRFDRDGRAMLRGIAEVILDRWAEPDEGIWEKRAGRMQHIHSKVMAWVGLTRLLELEESVGIGIDTSAVANTADAIRSWVLGHGYDPVARTFVAVAGRTDLDASLLVLPIVKFLDRDDHRVVSTVGAIERRLGAEELVFRYRESDGLPGREGAFVICSFWLVEALAHIGRVEEATRRFESLLTRGNDLGLLGEEVDPATGAALGNYPQAFSHVGLINAALTLERVRSADGAPRNR